MTAITLRFNSRQVSASLFSTFEKLYVLYKENTSPDTNSHILRMISFVVENSRIFRTMSRGGVEKVEILGFLQELFLKIFSHIDLLVETFSVQPLLGSTLLKKNITL
jgi:hypothetical protein